MPGFKIYACSTDFFLQPCAQPPPAALALIRQPSCPLLFPVVIAKGNQKAGGVPGIVCELTAKPCTVLAGLLFPTRSLNALVSPRLLTLMDPFRNAKILFFHKLVLYLPAIWSPCLPLALHILLCFISSQLSPFFFMLPVQYMFPKVCVWWNHFCFVLYMKTLYLQLPSQPPHLVLPPISVSHLQLLRYSLPTLSVHH